MIEGFEIGHHTADGDGWLTGTTVVVARGGAVGGVDVRGGGPGTRETDLLNPTTAIDRVHAVVLTGGSAYGLAAANGVMAGLEHAGIGWPVGLEPHQVVPIVPAAVIFDLGRGGAFRNRPTEDFGRLALAAATSEPPATGSVGAGTGAVCGGIKGGFGYVEKELDSGVSVAAAVVVNAAGSVVDPATGRLWADRMQLLATPADDERDALVFDPHVRVVEDLVDEPSRLAIVPRGKATQWKGTICVGQVGSSAPGPDDLVLRCYQSVITEAIPRAAEPLARSSCVEVHVVCIRE